MEISRRHFILTGLAGAAAACSSTDGDASAASGADGGSGASGASGADGASGSDEAAASTTTTTQAPPTPIDAPAYDGPDPFSLGVASGDPDATSVVLWTRLLDTSGDHDVALDVALDDTFAEPVHSALHPAPGAHANSVHAVVGDLEPDTWYWYRFRIGDHESSVGRTRTLPDSGTPPVRFGFSSCQNWEQGTYAAHRHLAESDLDFFIWLGDYIYEYGPNDQGVTTASGPRIHDSPEVTDLDAYRDRYRLYRSDPWLQAHHAAHPWFVTWDDHEVDNNHAGLNAEDGADPTRFAARRDAAYQAWWEHMPVRLDAPVPGQPFVIHRRAQWGDLIDLHILDGRQYRDPQPTDGTPVDLAVVADLGVQGLGPTARSDTHSLLGLDQRAWLIDGVAQSTAVWTTIANQIYMHGLNALPGDVPSINTDSWDGYFGERQVILDTLSQHTDNLVVLTGDFHAATIADLRADPFDTTGPIVGTELMAPAISSRFPQQLLGLAPIVLGFNPHIRHFDPTNGFMTCEVTAERWNATLHHVVDSTDEMSTLATAARVTIDESRPGVGELTLST